MPSLKNDMHDRRLLSGKFRRGVALSLLALGVGTNIAAPLVTSAASAHSVLFPRVAFTPWILPAQGDVLATPLDGCWIHYSPERERLSSYSLPQPSGPSAASVFSASPQEVPEDSPLRDKQRTEQVSQVSFDEVEVPPSVDTLVSENPATEPASSQAAEHQPLGLVFPQGSPMWISAVDGNRDEYRGYAAVYSEPWLMMSVGLDDFEPQPPAPQPVNSPGKVTRLFERAVQTGYFQSGSAGTGAEGTGAEIRLLSQAEEQRFEGPAEEIFCDGAGLDSVSSGCVSAEWNTEWGTDGCDCDSCTGESGNLRTGRRYLRENLHLKTSGTQRELAPLQVLWPDRWAWAAAADPWPRVFQAEAAPSAIVHAGSLHCPAGQVLSSPAEINPARLAEDVPVSQMTLSIQPKSGRMPTDRRPEAIPQQRVQQHLPGTERGWNMAQVHWSAPETTHAPLYFEEISLERGGYSRGYLQPVYSGVRFVTTAALLPGLMTIDPPNSTQYELGEVRPGSVAPYSVRRPEWTVKAIAVQAGTVLGFSYIIP